MKNDIIVKRAAVLSFLAYIMIINVGTIAAIELNLLNENICVSYHTGYSVDFLCGAETIEEQNCSGWHVGTCTFLFPLIENSEQYRINRIVLDNGNQWNHINGMSITAILDDNQEIEIYDGNPGYGGQIILDVTADHTKKLRISVYSSKNRSTLKILEVTGAINAYNTPVNSLLLN